MAKAEMGRGWESSGLRRARDIRSSKIQLSWLLLHYGIIKVQPAGCHLQLASWLHKFYSDFFFLLCGLIYFTEYIPCWIKAVCQKPTAVAHSLKRGSLMECLFSFSQGVGAGQSGARRLHLPPSQPSRNDEKSNIADVNAVN